MKDGRGHAARDERDGEPRLLQHPNAKPVLDVEALELVQQGLANWEDDRWSEMSRGMGREGEQLNSDEHHLRIFWRKWNTLMTGTGK